MAEGSSEADYVLSGEMSSGCLRWSLPCSILAQDRGMSLFKEGMLLLQDSLIGLHLGQVDAFHEGEDGSAHDPTRGGYYWRGLSERRDLLHDQGSIWDKQRYVPLLRRGSEGICTSIKLKRTPCDLTHLNPYSMEFLISLRLASHSRPIHEDVGCSAGSPGQTVS